MTFDDNARIELVNQHGKTLARSTRIYASLEEARVDAAKRALGERGPVWWSDGAPDLNRRMARNTVYADWFNSLAPDPGN